ncbi:MAG: single-stranded DNA-binding protein [Candidatus Yanofskybacteria bacterium]|nr:single-stranded DNA-binding protein [Candidatus Yanofskybacteria bacterium]
MNLNKVFLIGRLTRDPEVRSTPSGQQVATIGLATSRVWNDQATRQKRESTEFHTIIAWGRLAEICAQYLKKGSLALFEGRLQTRTWEDKTSGQKRYATEIVAESMQLGPRSAGSFPSAGAGNQMDSVKPAASNRQPTAEPDIPVINEDELTVSGIEEEPKPIKDTDLPF